MSLQHAAQHLAAHGRGPDTTLVHMTPGEVKSLNDLAMAHGGQLTINPHTGLPEAGFLSSILPMVAGMALGPAGMGLFESAGMAGLGVGALTGLATGSLSKGLMAGMGAYGGAGLGDALAKSGMEASAEVATQKEALAQSNKALADAAAQNNLYTNPADFTKGLTDQGQNLMANQQAANQRLANVMDTARQSYADNGLMGKFGTMLDGTKTGLGNIASNAGGNMGLAKYGLAAAAPAIGEMMQPKKQEPMKTDSDPGQQYNYTPGMLQGPYTTDTSGREQQYFNHRYTPRYADGGTVEPGTPTQYSYDPMAQMFNKIESTPSDDQNKQKAEEQAQRQAGGASKGPMTDAQFAAQQAQGEANMNSFNNFGETVSKGIMSMFSQPPMMVQLAQAIANGIYGGMPTSSGGVSSSSGSPMGGIASRGTHGQAAAAVAAANAAAAAGGRGAGSTGGNPGTGNGGTSSGVGTGIGSGAASGAGLATGGISGSYNLGGYSDGGRLLRGPGDGVSDSIPATIGHKQPARLADGEFVVPARIVSELGNGSTDAGARRLYEMMDRIQQNRAKTVGKGKVAVNSRSDKHLPA